MIRVHFRNRSVMCAVAIALLNGAQARPDIAAQEQSRNGVPIFVVDPQWPQMPDNWMLGQVSGVGSEDVTGHVWIVNRPSSLAESSLYAEQNPRLAECCVRPTPILEFEENGKFVRGWGGPGQEYEWPKPERGFEGPRTYGDCCRPENGEHGAFIDSKGFFWTGGNSSASHHILKFTKDGQFVLQIGREGQSKGSNDTQNLNKPTGFAEFGNELFVSDGYVNRRVVVFDINTGAYKRHWGAYGNKPDDSAPRTPSSKIPGPAQFNLVHGIDVSRDGLLYVADRVNNRVQVFKTDGTFVTEGLTAQCGTSNGSAFDVALSPDPEQEFLYVADGCNGHVVILRRSTLERIGQFGRNGRLAGEWFHLHSIATDVKGNIYTGESLGARAQKFVFKGYGRSAKGSDQN